MKEKRLASRPACALEWQRARKCNPGSQKEALSIDNDVPALISPVTSASSLSSPDVGDFVGFCGNCVRTIAFDWPEVDGTGSENDSNFANSYVLHLQGIIRHKHMPRDIELKTRKEERSFILEADVGMCELKFLNFSTSTRRESVRRLEKRISRWKFCR